MLFLSLPDCDTFLPTAYLYVYYFTIYSYFSSHFTHRQFEIFIYYIFQESKRRGVSNYQTLGIPIVPSPTSSLPAPPYTPTSLPAPPYTSLSSQGSGHTPQPGLNGAIPNGQIPRSSDGESDHEYYNDVDRLQREMQPLHVPRNETTV